MSEFSDGVEKRLKETIVLYQERNEIYKDNFRIVGDLMHLLFPDGPPVVKSSLDYQKWHLFELFIVKLTRFANNYDEGHNDSLADMRVYLAMLEQLYRDPQDVDPLQSWENGDIR